ncbi:hypothetical protein THAOC_33250, partial [Thalassiosira oceanica]
TADTSEEVGRWHSLLANAPRRTTDSPVKSNRKSQAIRKVVKHDGPTKLMSTNGRQSSSWKSSNYIHQFGFELAKEVLGVESVDRVARDALVFLQRNNTSFAHYTASWRHESCRYPWSLPGGDGNGSLQALFVDISFDFTFFPVSFSSLSCHMIKAADLGPEQDGWSNGAVESESVAVAVAVRFGALGNADGGGFTYLKGTRPLTASDLDEHCRSVDLVLEEMTECNTMARLISEGIMSTSRWLISCSSATAVHCCTSKEEDGQAKETANWAWTIKLHYDQLKAQGYIPLSAANNEGEHVGQEVLMTLLQARPKCSFVSVPTEAAKSTLSKINPELIKLLPNPPIKSPEMTSLEEAKKTHAHDLATETEESTSIKESSKKVVTKKSSSRQETSVYATQVRRGKKKAKFTWS